MHIHHQIGELSREEDVLEWLIENKSTGDDEEVIEDVTAKTLTTLIGNVDNLVVLFCKWINAAPKIGTIKETGIKFCRVSLQMIMELMIR